MGLIGLRYALVPEAPVIEAAADPAAATPGLPVPR